MEQTVPREQDEYHEHLKLILDSLELNIEGYKNGRLGGWLAVSTQLYVLLCDRSRGLPLILRLLPEFRLHSLKRKDPKEKSVTYLLYHPGIVFGQGVIDLNLFEVEGAPIPLEEWLEQTVAVLGVREANQTHGVYITLKDLISETRNQAGGGHFDSEIRRVLRAASAFKYIEGQRRTPFYIKALLAIAEYVIGQIHKQYEEAYKGEAKIEDKMLVIRGMAHVSSEPPELVDLRSGLFLHAICYVYMPVVNAPRVLFQVLSPDGRVELIIETDDDNQLYAKFLNEEGQAFCTQPFPENLFQERLCYILCTLTLNKDGAGMFLELSIDEEHRSRIEIDSRVPDPLKIKFSTGSTFDGKRNTDMRIADMGLGSGIFSKRERHMLWRQVQARIADLVVPA